MLGVHLRLYLRTKPPCLIFILSGEMVAYLATLDVAFHPHGIGIVIVWLD